jgi:hypothetical protein
MTRLENAMIRTLGDFHKVRETIGLGPQALADLVREEYLGVAQFETEYPTDSQEAAELTQVMETRTRQASALYQRLTPQEQATVRQAMPLLGQNDSRDLVRYLA